jgi:lipopolysaccharide transport system ATP-binding protein
LKPILEIQSISKKFRINHEQQPYLSLRDSLSSLLKSKTTHEDFWALKDVSFDVMPGDTIGVIGKNGAGKSTLLKILSKITPPTKGKITCRGRIASLLEVGTGFHPELTGRENIFMNGSILGMRKVEIQKNFDAIVDFAGVEKFLDTPLKHYSSGMQLRLAFAVAAFLENEILIIDEVLAVGDAEFQKKCLGKMDDVSKSGRTILFVSHQLGIVTSLCKKTILLDMGQVNSYGETTKIISNYFNLRGNDQNRYSNSTLNSNKEILISEIATIDKNSNSKEEFYFNEPIILKLKIRINENKITNIHIGVALLDKTGVRVFTVVRELKKEEMVEDTIQLNVELQPNLIAPNVYTFTVAAFIPSVKVVDIAENICRVTIIDSGTELLKFEGIDYGSVIMKAVWEKV